MDVDQKAPLVAPNRKGRGFREGGGDRPDVLSGPGAKFDRLDESSTKEAGLSAGTAARSVEGWIVFVSGVHEEATEEDIQEKFADYGEIKNMHLNLDRRTGYVKGYALVEYEMRREAEQAIKGIDGTQLLEQTLHCDFAFVRPPHAGSGGGGGAAKPRRGRSNSPSGRTGNLQSRLG